MSVENADSQSTVEFLDDKVMNMGNTHEKDGNEQPPAVPEAAAPQSSSMDAAFASNHDTKQSSKSTSTAWLQNLGEKELMDVFNMKDEPFLATILATILAVSSWSSSSRGQTDRLAGKFDGQTVASRPLLQGSGYTQRASIALVEHGYPTGFFSPSFSRLAEISPPWSELVGVSEVQAAHQRICNDFQTGEGVLITSRWISSVKAALGEQRRTMSSSEILGARQDDVRIRDGTENNQKRSDLEDFWYLLKHVRVVFPSAVAYVTGEAKPSSTLITLSPAILRELGARRVYDALNAGFESIFPGRDFLSGLTAQDESTWVDSLVAAVESKKNADTQQQIPLFAVLLFKLERAIYDAYQASQRTLVRESGAGTPATIEEKESSVEVSVAKSTFVESLEGRLKVFENTRLGDEEKKIITSDFAKACGGSDASSIHLSDLILTPFPLVSRCMDAEGIGSLAAVDDVVRTSLEKFNNATKLNGDLSEDNAPEADVAAPQEQDSAEKSTWPENPSQTGGTGSKKKKKKKFKKKKRILEMSSGRNEAKSSPTSEGPNAAVEESVTSSSESVAPQAQATCIADDHTDLNDVDEKAEVTATSSTETDATEEDSAPQTAQAQPESVAEESTEEIGQNPDKPPEPVLPETTGEHQDDDDDAWETVEVKPRGQRKKSFERSNTSSSRNSGSFHESGGKKSKEKRTAASRRKNNARKMVRDILSNVVDSVDDEVARRRAAATAAATPPLVPVVAAPPIPSDNPWKKGPPLPSPAKNSATASADGTPVRPKTLRDIVVGNSAAIPARPAATTGPVDRRRDLSQAEGGNMPGTNGQPKKNSTPPPSPKKPQNSESPKKGPVPKSTPKKQDPAPASPKRGLVEKSLPKSVASTDSPSKQGSAKWSKGKSVPTADQNTAPTYQETVSASATKLSQTEPNKSDSSSGDTDEAPQNREREAATTDKETSSSGPPLVTFVSPENVNSATSSVASSLEVPHTSRRHHHSLSTPDTEDVGCHLLDVCDRLSRDMSLFMKSREQTVNVRRRERGAVLVALQNSLSKIWPGMCRVEMYGSCATLLDLPSSDLDVVVVGLDHSEIMLANQMAASQQQQKGKKSGAGKGGRSNAKDGSRDDTRQAHPAGFVQLSPYRNSERVKQLAKQIDGQPWAVQVKSLPNASVPVIKILADPSKLPGKGAEWPVPSDSSTAADETQPPSDASAVSGPISPSQNLYAPWRGSDIMNGLISLDITFEGPEHGGLFSTDFSVHVVTEACEQAGLPPEGTPFVQCLMVLKELLVQRKLNEPYSGGLSSYALLLLLLALVHERALIRQEIERVEIQRQAMAEGGVSTYAGALVGATATEEKPAPATQPETSKPEQKPTLKHTQSWVNIAKKTGSTPTPSVSSEKLEKKTQEKPKLNRPASFADAVARPKMNVENSGAMGADRPSSAKASVDKPAPSVSVASVASSREPASVDPNSLGVPSFYPQGFDDVIEVLCTGETTAGKLLMHFLLYYGQYFDAQATAIDISGKHERGAAAGHQNSPYSYLSPYIPRRAPETIDPHTGMLVVDHIVVYDPLPGAENRNVARRCFAWQQVKWIFSQSYATLSSAVERSSSPPATPAMRPAASEGAEGDEKVAHSTEGTGDPMDPSSPLLRCLLSF